MPACAPLPTTVAVFGRSDQPWSGYDYDTLTDDLAAVLQQCGARDATILGSRWGGGEVAHYMSRCGGRDVKQAVLVASVVPHMLRPPTTRTAPDKGTFDELTEAMKKDRAKFRPDLPAFKVPTQIIHGTGDKTVPINAAGLAAANGITHSTLVEYDGSPHGLFASDKERFISDVMRFVHTR